MHFNLKPGSHGQEGDNSSPKFSGDICVSIGEAEPLIHRGEKLLLVHLMDLVLSCLCQNQKGPPWRKPKIALLRSNNRCILSQSRLRFPPRKLRNVPQEAEGSWLFQ